MSDRERERVPRPDPHTHSPTASPSTSIASFLPNLFGRRTSSKASSAQAHADGRKASSSAGLTREPIDEVVLLTSPPAGTAPLPGITATATAATASNSPISPQAPFHLDTALTLLEPGGTKTNAETVEIVKAISVYLANILLDHIGATHTFAELGLRPADIRILYARAIAFSAPSSDYQLRTAAIRLLAVLVGLVPPPASVLGPNPAQLPTSITPRSVYNVLTARSGGQGEARTNQMFVEIGALKALTQKGAVVDGMDGIVGYLLRVLADLSPDWTAWCDVDEPPAADSVPVAERGTPFGPITSATPATTAADAIDLISSIVQNRPALFSPADLSHIVRPVINFVWQGVLAGHASAGSTAGPPQPRHSQHATATGHPTSPPSQNLRRTTSLTVGRVEPFPLTPADRPEKGDKQPDKPDKPPRSPRAARCSKWSRPFTALCALVSMLFECTTLNDDLFDEMFELLCFAFGQDAMITAEASMAAHDLVRTMLGTKSGRRGELALRKVLEGRLKERNDKDVERKVTRGAVIIARLCMESDFVHSSLSLSFTGLAQSLVAALSTRRFPGTGEARGPEWARWLPVDTEILSLLDNHLTSLGENSSDDAWTEGEAACEVLNSIYPLIQTLAPDDARTLLKSERDPLVAMYGNIISRLPQSIGRLHSRLHSSETTAPPPFFHPQYIDLLLELGPNLDEETAGLVIDYYQRECLCLPFTSGWISNIWRLLEAFALSYDLPLARSRVSSLLYQDVYTYVDDLPEHRAQLVDQVIVPYLEKWLPQETDQGLLTEALGVLVSSAVSETFMREEERRKARSSKSEAQVEAEDASPEPPQAMAAAAAGGSFGAIRQILTTLAVEASCKLAPFGSNISLSQGTSPGPAPIQSPPVSSPSPTSAQTLAPAADVRTGRTATREQSSLRNLIRTLSPSREPSSSAVGMTQLLSPPAEDYFSSHSSSTTGPTQHTSCKAVYVVQAMIATFTRLAFSPQALGGRPARTLISLRCIIVFRDLLGLLYPISDPGQPQRMPSKCPRARLTILQWAMRLRADRKHRILFRDDINRFVEPFAKILFRTKKTEEEMRAAIEHEEARRRARASTQPGRTEDERGRSTSTRVTESAVRSRSRSKAQPLLRTTSADTPYNPMWCVPEHLAFETPPDNHPSEVLLTYDQNHPSLRARAPGTDGTVEGVWLPVSEYVRVLNGLLRWEHDWEIVSYILVFLPQQLGNKHYFHGIRATREVRGLLRVLCDGILEKENRWERRFHVPSFIKRTHINAAAYQSISILISYRSVFNRGECDRIIQSLVFGLEGNATLARPCLQTLTVCVYEMETYLLKHIGTILQATQQILSTPAVAVHILEFLVALGNSQLYRNFTEDQYRLVFAVAIGYVGEHNARTAGSDFTDPEQFTLSQHVIGLAYHVIYIWFLALKVTQRPSFVHRLVRGLLHAKSHRTPVDERMEVCFDWIARYTYGNADPKPATSFLSEVVMRDNDDPPKTMSWLLGGAIITVTAHQRTGWATITTTRATGQTSVVCKVENIPLVGLGETNADMTSLPAFLMANRKQINPAPLDSKEGGDIEEPEEKSTDDESTKSPVEKAESKTPTEKVADFEATADNEAVVESIISVKPTGETTVDNSISGYVWSGAAPSQRRKDVMIEPSYLGLHLLSSYPNADQNIPRGRPIPREPKFERALRGIDNTPVINTFKIAVLYVGPGQTTEAEILANCDGSPLYLDFLAGLGRIIRLKGQVDVFTGGLDKENDSDGQYAYAWWDDLAQMIFHAPTLMPNTPENTAKKRLVGNDYVKIVYNESGQDFKFDTIRTAFNFVNIIVSPYATREVADAVSLTRTDSNAGPMAPTVDEWGGDSEDFFKVQLQRADGLPDFSPIGEYKLVSRRNLPILVRQIAHYATSMAVRFQHTQGAPDATSAEYITIWRARWRAMQRLREMLPAIPPLDANDPTAKEIVLRDFTRTFSPPEQMA